VKADTFLRDLWPDIREDIDSEDRPWTLYRLARKHGWTADEFCRYGNPLWEEIREAQSELRHTREMKMVADTTWRGGVVNTTLTPVRLVDLEYTFMGNRVYLATDKDDPMPDKGYRGYWRSFMGTKRRP
jgi:hypothetical protein